MRNLFNFVLFQAVWVLAVGGAAKGLWWPGVAGALAFALIHFCFWRDQIAADLRVIAAALVLGFVIDSSFVALGWISYATPWPSALVAPAWIMSLWLAFSLTLNHSLSWMRGKHALAVAFGLIGGPLVFYFAARFWSAVHIHEPIWIGYGALALEWAIMTPLLLRIGSNRAAVSSGR